MMASTHAGFAAATYVAAVASGAVPGAFEGAAAAMIGGLMPDVDHPESSLGRRAPLLSLPLSALFGHRGATHSMFAIGLLAAGLQVAALVWPVIAPAALGLIIGYVSHVLADVLTPSGVPLMWPSPQRWRVPLVRTGSVFERLFALAVLGGLGWWLYQMPPALARLSSLVPTLVAT